MQKVWRIGAFTPEVAGTVRAFYNPSYQKEIACGPSFDAMLAKTQGNWPVLTERGSLDFARPDPLILAWVAPWEIPCSSRCAYYKLDASFRAFFPLGFCIALGESIELYSGFFEFMIRLGANKEGILVNHS
jgi:hypothetical protein